MKKYHVSDDGESRQCSATIEECQYGEHFGTVEEARERYESLNEDKLFAEHEKLINTVDHERMIDPDDIEDHGYTFEEGMVIDHIEDMREYVEGFQRDVAQGYKEDGRIGPMPVASCNNYLDKEEAQEALRRRDYDSFIRLHAIAATHAYGQEPGMIRFSADEFVNMPVHH